VERFEYVFLDVVVIQLGCGQISASLVVNICVGNSGDVIQCAIAVDMMDNICICMSMRCLFLLLCTEIQHFLGEGWEAACEAELTKLVSHHSIAHFQRHKHLAIMNFEAVSDEFGQYGTAPRPHSDGQRLCLRSASVQHFLHVLGYSHITKQTLPLGAGHCETSTK